MPDPALADRVKETTTSTGTGAITLLGAATGFQSIASQVATGSQLYYEILDNTSGLWEIGVGTLTIATNSLSRDNVLASTNVGTLVNFTSGTKDVFITAPAFYLSNHVPRGRMDGLILSTSASTNTLNIGSGVCRDSLDGGTILLSSAFTKVLQTTGSWASGSGANGLDTGVRANSTWYHLWAISKAGGTNGDILFSLSATAPTMPTGYTLKRRIGSVKSDTASNFIGFTQDGDSFSWKSRLLDVQATNPGTAAVSRTLTVPTGVRVRAKAVVGFGASAISDNPAGILITDLNTTDVAPSVTDATVLNYSATVLISNYFSPAEVWTNTNAQVRSRIQISGTNTTLYVITSGWYDPRGKDQ
jgi:hypothetical protein